MRIFWSINILLVVGAAAAAGWNYTRAHRQQSAAVAASQEAEKQLQKAQAAKLEAESAAPAAKPPAQATPTPATEAKPEPKVEAKPVEQTAKAQPAAQPQAVREPPIAGTTIPNQKHTGQPTQISAPPAPAKPREEPKDTPGSSIEGVPTKIGEYDVRPVKITKNADGSTTLDDRFTIKGDGTKGDPYRVPWELLLSCKDTFEPAAGLKKIPGRIAFLNEKFVRLDGYVAFPLMMQKPTELLSMLNQWDGCCIGVPPTPYDAVEAKLTKVVTGDSRFATTGVVIGKFKVDPYVVKNPKGDWLVSMYTMSAADFTAGDIGPGGSQ